VGKPGVPSCSDAEFIELFSTLPSIEAVAAHTGTNIRNVFARRRRIEAALDVKLVAGQKREQGIAADHAPRVHIEVRNGTVLVGGDAHYQPGQATTAHRAFVHLVKELQPAAVIANGDMFDGARIGRHPKIGFLESAPSVKEELEAVDERLGEILDAAPRCCKLHWNLGNHDLRFEAALAAGSPEYEGVRGLSLKDHFPQWVPSWSVWINNDVVVKHRYKGGAHAAHNNTLYAGKSIVTNHLHSPKVIPFADYNGRRYGVDTGTMSEPYSRPFVHYTEDNPVNWTSAFAVLTFKDGKLMMPELVLKWSDDAVEFRGQVISV
jgi:hypothetical protein